MFSSLEQAQEIHRKYHHHAEGRKKQFDSTTEYFKLHEPRIDWISSNIKSGDKLLDIGCSSGEFSNYLTKRCGCVCDGIEINEDSVKNACESVKIVCGDAEHLPFPDNYYDVVLMSEVLEHIFDPDLVLAEAYRVLKNGGIIVGSVPHVNSPVIKDKPAITYRFHARDFSEYELSSYLDFYFDDVVIEPSFVHCIEYGKSPFWWVFKGVKNAKV